MKRRTAIVVLGLAVVVAALAAWAFFFRKNAQTTANATPLTWNSPRFREVEAEWEALYQSFGGHTWTKENAVERDSQLDAILAKRFSREDLHQLAASADQLPVRAENCSPFANAVIQYMLFTFFITGDRENLVTLLSTRFRGNIRYGDIEGVLVVSAVKLKPLEDPILILGDAYTRCKDLAVRFEIAAVIRRGFDTMHIEGLGPGTLGDDEYVNRVMQWYRTYKDRLVPNVQYLHNRNVLPSNPAPLFLWTATPGKKK